MTVAYTPVERAADHERRALLNVSTIRRGAMAAAALGIAVLLVLPAPLVGVGYVLAMGGWLVRARSLGLTGGSSTPLVAGWLSLLVGSVIGLLATPLPDDGVSRLGAVLAALSVFWWLSDWARTDERLRLASWTLVAACLVGALVVLALIRGQLPASALTGLLAPVLGPFAMFPGISGDVLEVNSRFPVHQYGLAYLIVVIVPFLVGQAVLGSGRLGRAACALGALALTVLLAATETRGAVLAMAFAVALVASSRSRWFWALLPAGALGLYLLLARGIIARSIETEWLETRLSIWTRSLSLLADYPFSGSGLGMRSFAEVFAWTHGLADPYQVVHSHNVLIQAYAEQGLFGLLGLLFVLVGSLAAAHNGLCRAHPNVRPVAAGTLGALSASCLYGMTDQVPTTNVGLAIVAALGALACATSARAAAPRVGSIPRSGRHLPVATLFGLAGVGLVLAAVLPMWLSGLALNVGSTQLAAAALGRASSVEARSAALLNAEWALSTAITLHPSNIPAYRALGKARLLRHDVPGAVAALDSARATFNLSAYEATQFGRLYYELGFWQQAFDLWRAAGQIHLLRAAADEQASRKELAAAAAAHAALIELQPDESEHYANLAKAVLAGPVPGVDEAMRWFGRAAELNPESRRSLARQLVLEAETCRINERRGGGRLDLCQFWFGLASRVDPTYDKPEVELGSVLYYRGRFTEAAEHFSEATRRDPRNSSTWHQLGEALEGAGRFPEAVAAFEEAVRLAPRRAGLRASLARIYAVTGRCADATREIQEALRLEPSSAAAQAGLARLAECRP